jgi:NADH:ubiquinone oxidoreductase subunit K
MVIAIAAAEAAIVLAIIIVLFRHRPDLDVQTVNTLKN